MHRIHKNGGESSFVEPHLSTISRRSNTCQGLKRDFYIYLDVIFRRLEMKIFTKQLCFGIFVAAMLLVGRFGHAQAVYGSLFGTVLDNTGAVVPNAKVTVTDVAKGTQTVVQSNGEGFWRVDNLIPDTYTVQVESGAFAPGHAEGVELNAGTSQMVNISLQVQGSQQTVTVTS